MRESQSRVVLIPTQEAYSFLNRKVLEECHWKAICCRKRLKEPVDQRSFAQVEKLQVCNPQQQGKRLSENPQKHSRKSKSALNNCEVQRSPPSYSREVVIKKKKISCFLFFSLPSTPILEGPGTVGKRKRRSRSRKETRCSLYLFLLQRQVSSLQWTRPGSCKIKQDESFIYYITLGTSLKRAVLCDLEYTLLILCKMEQENTGADKVFIWSRGNKQLHNTLKEQQEIKRKFLCNYIL